MEIPVRTAVFPYPDTRAKTLVLVVVLIIIMVIWKAGYDLLDAITLALGAGFAGTKIANALLASPGPGIPGA